MARTKVKKHAAQKKNQNKKNEVRRKKREFKKKEILRKELEMGKPRVISLNMNELADHFENDREFQEFVNSSVPVGVTVHNNRDDYLAAVGSKPTADSEQITNADPDPDHFVEFMTGEYTAQSGALKTMLSIYHALKISAFKSNIPYESTLKYHEYQYIC